MFTLHDRWNILDTIPYMACNSFLSYSSRWWDFWSLKFWTLFLFNMLKSVFLIFKWVICMSSAKSYFTTITLTFCPKYSHTILIVRDNTLTCPATFTWNCRGFNKMFLFYSFNISVYGRAQSTWSTVELFCCSFPGSCMLMDVVMSDDAQLLGVSLPWYNLSK